MKKKIDGILASNPSLAKQVAMLLKEELENEVAEVTDLTQVTEPAGTNDAELVPEAPGAETLDVTNADALADGHEVDEELTAEDPVTPEQIEAMVDELPVEDLEEEAEGLEEVIADDEAKIKELEEVIEEATQLISELKSRIVFTESVKNKVNARILTEAAKILAGKKSLTENKK